jgi:hypothetical protein
MRIHLCSPVLSLPLSQVEKQLRASTRRTSVPLVNMGRSGSQQSLPFVRTPIYDDSSDDDLNGDNDDDDDVDEDGALGGSQCACCTWLL